MKSLTRMKLRIILKGLGNSPESSTLPRLHQKIDNASVLPLAFFLGKSFRDRRVRFQARLPVHLGKFRKILPLMRQNAKLSPTAVIERSSGYLSNDAYKYLIPFAFSIAWK